MTAPEKKDTELRKFLKKELEKPGGYRRLAEFTKVSKGALEDIVKGQGKRYPQIETLERIAEAYGKPLWEVQRMAGVNLGLPQTATESAQRLDQLVQQVPELRAHVEWLKTMWNSDPDYVKGMIIGMEARLAAGLPPDLGSHQSHEQLES